MERPSFQRSLFQLSFQFQFALWCRPSFQESLSQHQLGRSFQWCQREESQQSRQLSPRQSSEHHPVLFCWV
ncbi:hypothetical protein VR46_12725 [Streptomyces sp. NRRL S-444]|nr:hypothetical protein VR46_12725 [Streptomyces sp. NRRL S-444]